MSDERQRAVDLAYRALARRERTVAEMRTYLEGKKVEPSALRDAVDELQDAGFLDDVRFAERFAEDKRQLEQWGSLRIELDLRRRGVAADIIEAVVGSAQPCDELEAAQELLAQRMSGELGDDRERDRAWRMLVRKGYPRELAYEAVRNHERRRLV